MPGIIYRISSPLCTETYIGSTTNTLKRRMSHHAHHYRQKKHNMAVFSIFDKVGFANCIIESLETIDTDDKVLILEREQFHIRNNPNCVNFINAITTMEEKLVLHNVRSARYYEKHKEEIAKKQAEKITCECGAIVAKASLKRHKDTSVKHQEFIKAK